MAFNGLLSKSNEEKHGSINWEEIGFGLTQTDYMYIMKCSEDGIFSNGTIVPYGNIEISPASTIINYGQGLLEGMKAYRTVDGNIVIFKGEENAFRMQDGAERVCMKCPTVDQFFEAVKLTVLANKHWVPPTGIGALYLRALLMGTGARLGLGPSPEYTFLLYASPLCADYFKAPVNLVVEDTVRRAVLGGTGCVNSVSNYSPVFQVVSEAKANGFSDVLFLDAATGKNIEELSSGNIFLVKGNEILTPIAQETVLPGVTRKCVMELAASLGYRVTERVIPFNDVVDTDEVFCTGALTGLTPVDSITYLGKKFEYKSRAEKSATLYLLEVLTGIQTGRVGDRREWTLIVD